MWIDANRQRSYYKWGLQELNRRMETRCEVGYTEYEVINEFIHDMDNYACINLKNSIKFSCAADAGRYVLNGKVCTYI